jgi:dTDP-glucose 4,6-dehydratase
LLSWKPNHAGLEGFKKGLSKTIEWFSKPENLSNYKSHIYNV